MSNLKTIGIEVAKTALGVGLGRTAVVMGEKVLKVSEEADPKKKKMKEVGVGVAVAAVGTFGATKVPKEYQSFLGGVAVGGALSAISPFGKPDKGFIPVLNGAEEPDYTEINSLSETTELDRYLDNDLDTELDQEINEEVEISALASPENEEEAMDVDFSEVN